MFMLNFTYFLLNTFLKKIYFELQVGFNLNNIYNNSCQLLLQTGLLVDTQKRVLTLGSFAQIYSNDRTDRQTSRYVETPPLLKQGAFENLIELCYLPFLQSLNKLKYSVAAYFVPVSFLGSQSQNEGTVGLHGRSRAPLSLLFWTLRDLGMSPPASYFRVLPYLDKFCWGHIELVVPTRASGNTHSRKFYVFPSRLGQRHLLIWLL